MLDIQGNRALKKYTRAELLKRILWAAAWPLFRLSPRPLHAWRVRLLKIFGAKIGKHVHIYPSARIFFPWNLEVGEFTAIGEKVEIYNLGRVVIGKSVTVSQHAYLCAGTHDFRDPLMPLLKPQIYVGDSAWLCAASIIGPNVEVGSGAVVGLGCVLTSSAEAWGVYGGNPARYLKTRHLGDVFHVKT